MSHKIEPPSPLPGSSRKSLWSGIRTRILQGLFVVLPVAVTFWIIAWLYTLLRDAVIGPIAVVVVYLAGARPDGGAAPAWFEDYLAPVVAIVFVALVLYVLGILLNSKLHKLMDWVLLQVPVVTTVYSAVLNVVKTMQRSGDTDRFQRVVLVPFPHPHVKAPAFVTSTCQDVATGKTIVCVYVPTTPVPTSGYMLMYPEDQVTEVSWDLNETLQAIVSGGLTVPPRVEYYPGGGGAN